MHRGKLIRCDAPEAVRAATGAPNLEAAFVQIVGQASRLPS
jgi:hypothetical protein